MLADFDPCAEFMSRRIIAYPTDSRCVIFLQRLVHLVLLVGAIADITSAVIKRIQINMVNFKSITMFKKIIMQ